jgi:hypothetical protein
MMRLIFFSILILAFNSCQENKKQNSQTVSIHKKDHLIDAFGKVDFDTSTFHMLNCGLYINSLGIIAYKAIDRSLKFDSTKSLDIYVTTVYDLNSESTGDKMKEMRFVLDTTTFVLLEW